MSALRAARGRRFNDSILRADLGEQSRAMMTDGRATRGGRDRDDRLRRRIRREPRGSRQVTTVDIIGPVNGTRSLRRRGRSIVVRFKRHSGQETLAMRAGLRGKGKQTSDMASGGEASFSQLEWRVDAKKELEENQRRKIGRQERNLDIDGQVMGINVRGDRRRPGSGTGNQRQPAKTDETSRLTTVETLRLSRWIKGRTEPIISVSNGASTRALSVSKGYFYASRSLSLGLRRHKRSRRV